MPVALNTPGEGDGVDADQGYSCRSVAIEADNKGTRPQKSATGEGDAVEHSIARGDGRERKGQVDVARDRQGQRHVGRPRHQEAEIAGWRTAGGS